MLFFEKARFQRKSARQSSYFCAKDVEEIINIQPIGAKAKAYQVKQVRNLILKYKLRAKDE